MSTVNTEPQSHNSDNPNMASPPPSPQSYGNVPMNTKPQSNSYNNSNMGIPLPSPQGHGNIPMDMAQPNDNSNPVATQNISWNAHYSTSPSTSSQSSDEDLGLMPKDIALRVFLQQEIKRLKLEELDRSLAPHFLALVDWENDVPELEEWYNSRRAVWARERKNLN